MSESDLRELARDDDDLAFLRSLRMRSAITLALQARGQVKGTLTLGVAWSGRRYNEDDVRFAWILSGRVALTLDNSGLFADLEQAEAARAEIAETLQRGLMPPPLPHIPGWSLAAMYRPAGAENEVGGDFYDAFPVADGWMLVIGDVTGRGAAGGLDHRARPLHAAHRRGAHQRSPDRPGHPQPRPPGSPRHLALQHRGPHAQRRPAATGADGGRRAPAAAPRRRRGGARGGRRATRCSGAFADGEWRIGESRVEPGQQLVMTTDGIVEAEGRGRPLRRGSPAGRACRCRQPRRRSAAPRGRAASLHR